MIHNTNLAALVLKAAGATGICASVLDVEVTEAVIVSDLVAASRSLAAVRELDATVSLDDFGTGYSSLSYRTELPVGRIKIDCHCRLGSRTRTSLGGHPRDEEKDCTFFRRGYRSLSWRAGSLLL